MENKVQEVVDERVEQETARIVAKNFRTGAIVLAVLLAVKIVMAVRGTAWVCVLPESAALAAGFIVLLIQWTKRSLWGPKDERTLGESTAALRTAWQAMAGALCCVILVMIPLDVDKDAYRLTILFNAVVFGIQERRMVKAGVFHQQGENITRKSAVKMIAGVGVFGLAAVLIGSLLKGEMAPWWAYVLAAVLFMLMGALVAGSTWVREVVSELNADEAVKAAEREDSNEGA